jgi:hypothetical protein
MGGGEKFGSQKSDYGMRMATIINSVWRGIGKENRDRDHLELQATGWAGLDFLGFLS